MKAIVRTHAGKEFSAMKVMDIESPEPAANELKVRMSSSRINPVDMDLMKGFPSLKYKNSQIGGIDGAGKIIAIGSEVSNYKVGENVFFYRPFSDIGTWAQEIVVPIAYVAKIPQQLTLEEAGAITLPLLTAYEGITALNPQSGESILIHGAGGGVGFQAVQLAKHLGMKVIVNASSKDNEDLEKIGVDTFIDYTTTDFYEFLKTNPPTYVFDVVGKETLKKSILLKPKVVISTTFPDVTQLHKTGVNLPGILKFMMKLMNRKHRKLASALQVKLIGQVTGANAKQLNLAKEMVNAIEQYQIRQYDKQTLTELASHGISKQSIGKVIVFND